jgi:hypothetical protein
MPAHTFKVGKRVLMGVKSRSVQLRFGFAQGGEAPALPSAFTTKRVGVDLGD